MSKRTGAQRHKYKSRTFLPTADFGQTRPKCGHWVFDKDGNLVDKNTVTPSNSAPAVHDDRIFDTFDWGAGKNWAQHGGRSARREWMKRGDGETSYECKG